MVLICQDKLYVEKDLIASKDVTGQYLFTTITSHNISSERSKLSLCEHFFTEVTALYPGFICSMSHSFNEYCAYFFKRTSFLFVLLQ